MNNGALWYMQNFENDGIVNLDKNLAVVPGMNQFLGTGNQRIWGVGSTRFYDVLFKNQLVAAAFSLEQNITIAHQVDFTKGVVTTLQSSPDAMMNMVIMENGASWVNASDNSFVDGFVRKIGNSSFTFPIGNGGFYRYASISAPTASTDHFSARYLYLNPDVSGYNRTQKESSITYISNKEYWIVNRTNGTSAIQLTLSWDITKTSAPITSDLSRLLIVRWDGVKWINEGNTATTGNATVGSITANVTGFGVFTLATSNHIPVAVDDYLTVIENNGLSSGNVLTNDTDVDNDPLTVTQYIINGITYPAGTSTVIPGTGTIKINADGSYTFTPAIHYKGTVPTVIYTVSDGIGTATGNLFITVTPADNSIVVTANPVTTQINLPVNGAVTATDADGDVMTFTKGSNPAHGTVVVNSDGTYTYTPDKDYGGDDSFTVTVSNGKGGTVTVTVLVTVIPLKVMATPIVTYENTPGNGAVTALGGVGDVITFTKGSDPAHGTAVVNADGTYTYTPSNNYYGTDSFTIIVSNGKGGTVTVTINVNVIRVSSPPVAVPDIVTVLEYSSVTIPVLDNDDFGTDGPSVGSITVTNAANGSVTVNDGGTPNNPTDDKVVYTPDPNFSGTDNFTYTICSANGLCATTTVSVTVTPLSNLLLVNKRSTRPVQNSDGTFTLKYIISLTNVGITEINNIHVADDLTKVFVNPITFNVVDITATGRLVSNGLYNGVTDINTLSQLAISALNPGKKDSINIEVKLDSHGFVGEVRNQAILDGIIVAKGVVANVYSDDLTGIGTKPRVTVTAIPEVELTIPDAFSPNNDGYNDKFVIIHPPDLQLRFEVFNRWGSKVFLSNDYQNEWDGRGVDNLLGQDLPNGTYFYVIKTINKKTGATNKYSGSITLRR